MSRSALRRKAPGRGLGVVVARLALGLALVLAAPAGAAADDPERLALRVDQGKLIRLDRPAAKVFVANPAIADVQVPGSRAVFVFGKSNGTTTLYALDAADRTVVAREVVVRHDVASLGEVLDDQAPRAGLRLTTVRDGLIVRGAVDSPAEAREIVALVDGYVGEGERVINRLTVRGPAQVSLHVRVAEMSRQVSKQLGFNWNALFNAGDFTFGLLTGRPIANAADAIARSSAEGSPDSAFGRVDGGDVAVTGVIDALEEDGVMRLLAEPTLTAVSGETASFLAGGEFPIPVSQDDDTLSVEFKKFGVALDFTPTVLGPGRINLKVRPEVSEISREASINTGGVDIPGLLVRRAETTVELASGQSFAIAGLLQNSSSNTIDKLPGAGDVPVLGALFRSSRFQREETELVIIVTPYVVAPVGAGDLASPDEGFRPPSDLERIFMQRVATTRGPAAGPGPIGVGRRRLVGPAGFAY